MKVTEEHVEARKGQILDAAWECFAELGYHQTTMAAIAAAAGLSAGAIYLYFENKEALLRAIGDRSRAMNRQLVADAMAGSNDPIAALHVIGRAMLAIFTDPRFEESTRVNIELWPELLRNPSLAENLRADMAFWKEAVTSLLEDAKAKGELRPDVDARSLALLLISAWEGLRHYKLIDPDFSHEILLNATRAFVTEAGMAQVEAAAVFEGSAPEPGPPLGMPARERATSPEGG